MSASRSGRPSARRAPVAGALSLLLLPTVLGGCSSKPATTPTAWWNVAGPPQQVAAAPRPPVEMEDDGMEAQHPPLRRPPVPDDPSEPYSRNYGTRPPARRAEVPLPAKPTPVLPDDLPPAFRRKLVTSLAE